MRRSDMAGSFEHVTDNGKFSPDRFINNIDNLRDAYECVEDLCSMISRLQEENRGLREALEKLTGYNRDIRDGKINYRPHDHIDVAEEALRPGGGE